MLICHAQRLRGIQRDDVPARRIPFRTRLAQIDGGHRATRLGRAAAVQRFFLLSLITQDVVETHRAASNSLKLSSWNGAQDTRGVVPSRCANHIKRRAGNKRAAVQVTQRLIFLSAHQFIGTRPHLKKRERGGCRRARRPFSCI